MVMRRIIEGAALVVLLVQGGVATARAHDGVDRARALLEEARFDDALELADEVERGGGLDRAALLDVLEVRAVAAHALGRHADALTALRTLASVAPSHVLGPQVNPQLRERFDELRAETDPLRVEVTEESDGAAVVLRAEVTGDTLSLVRRVDVNARTGDEWRTEEGSIRLEGDDLRVRVAWYAEAFGPGGAVVATEGTRAEPRIFVPSGVGEDGGLSPWIFVGIGAGVLVVAAVIIIAAVAASSGDPQTPVEQPIIEWDGM
jgi:hypothetical protein